MKNPKAISNVKWLAFVTLVIASIFWYTKPIKIVSPLPLAPNVYAESYKIPEEGNLTEQQKAISIIKKTWRKDWKVGVAIAKCESGLRPTASNHNNNGTVDSGYFQINTIHNIDVKDPVANAAFAKVLYDEQGTAPWSASKSCWEGRVN